MTKRHFEAIAKILATADGMYEYHTKVYIANQLADYFEQENPRFDRDRFLKAAGVTDHV